MSPFDMRFALMQEALRRGMPIELAIRWATEAMAFVTGKSVPVQPAKAEPAAAAQEPEAG